MSEKSCKNCSKVKNCGMYLYAMAIGITRDDQGWHCSDYEPKKKTVKLFRYTYQEKGTIEQTNWTTGIHEEYLTRWRKLLKTEEKEIQI